MYKGDEPLIKPSDIKKDYQIKKKKFPNHVICGFAPIKNNIEEVENKNLIKLVKNSKMS